MFSVMQMFGGQDANILFHECGFHKPVDCPFYQNYSSALTLLYLNRKYIEVCIIVVGESSEI